MAEAPSPGAIDRSGLCIGCGACAVQGGGRMEWDEYRQLKPHGPAGWRDTPTPRFAATCPFSPAAADEDAIADARFPSAPVVDARIGRFESAYVGHAAEGDFRAGGSSGGMVSWVAAELLRQGMIDGVAHVVPLPGPGAPHFGYRISRSLEAIAEGARSRYHPVHLAQILDEIRTVPGRYAVVGIPCFLKAVNLARAAEPVFAERIVATLGLFCGHMKSGRLVDSFAWQLAVDPNEVAAVEYRRKDASRPANWYTAHLTLTDGSARWQDWWHLADGDWGAGFFQNSACNACDDVVAETADIAFGDAWVEPYSSDGRGTNVVIVRAPMLLDMLQGAIDKGRLALDPVDADFIAGTQDAGLRHRREGLAYRLTWHRRGITPRKRVAPRAAGIGWRRKLVYRTRAGIAAWSHRVAWVADRLGMPSLYIRWAKASLSLYQALTYSRGRLGAWLDRMERR
ncbi:Coenzyme F420 hydrogenase/dehydrogenase, beta subunit C-terminal domain [Sphingomonas sp. HT-1]|uniref:Coenzyme F420 hydrogenase/dehydrogenase, beta subunit C-terminal domain n=1 Tax=unclassified Sphingomonas TaxID=196159 RepID=UPI00056812BD|nr:MULTISPECIES: Coenzyme F420 hydrogenase/dehydrogenase, beta subunit C-terminal domain [unclassified Sphingomonas]KTF69113.1 coenzyme F420 hydrogenase [Sphingomonas sp. WG]